MDAASYDELVNVLASTGQPEDMCDLLEALLTPKELARLALRWQLVCRLENGEHQRQIAGQLGISLCKITRGSRELKRRRRFREIVRTALNGQASNLKKG